MFSAPITGKTRAIVAPDAADAYVQKQQPKPCGDSVLLGLPSHAQPARHGLRPGHRAGLQH